MQQTQRTMLLNAAQGHLSAGRLAQAEQACQSILDGSSNDIEALVLLSMIAQQQGALDRAEALVQRCAKMQPRNPSHFTNLGKVRVMTGRLKDAIESYDKALRIQPSFGLALAGKADALNQLGEREGALRLLEQWKGESGPDIGLIHATLLHQAGRNDQAVHVARRHLESPMTRGVVRVRLGLLLGQCLEAVGDFERAFQAYKDANELRASAGSYDPEKHRAAIDRLIDFFSRERLASLPRARSRTDLPVFIAGMARSGTTLIEQIISAHPRGFGAGELTTLDEIIAANKQTVGRAQPYPQWLAEAGQDSIDSMSQTYLHKLERLARDADRAVDKYLRNHQHLGLIWMLFPGARIIHCRRDAMDTCFSCYTSALSPMMHGYCSNLTHLGRHYGLFDRVMAHWRDVLDLPMLEVQYENLVADQETVTRAIIEFIGLEWDSRCLRPHEVKRSVRTLSYDQVRRPIYNRSIGRYKHFESHLGPLRDALRDGHALIP